MSDAHPGPALLAYLDGVLPPEQHRRVAAHLEHCPACRAELAELRHMQEGLHTTLDATLSGARLSGDADARIREVLRRQLDRRSRRWGEGASAWLAQFLRGVQGLHAAQAVLALILVLFSVSAYRALALPVAPPPQETLVFGDTRLAPGADAALRVIVRAVPPAVSGWLREPSASGLWPALLGAGATGALAAAPGEAAQGAPSAPVEGVGVTVSLLSESGRAYPLAAGTTDAFGTVEARFTVPDWPEGPAQLVVETRSAAGEERLVRAVALVRSYKVFLMSDKPVYRPGQTIYVRALVLDTHSLQPVSAGAPLLRFVLLDAAGREVAAQPVALSDYGVGIWEVAAPQKAVPPSEASSSYTLRAEIGDTRAERALLVSDTRLPPFRVELTPGRSYYAPGDAVTGTLIAETFYGMPLAHAQATLRLSVPGAAPRELRGETGADGVFAFAFAASGTGATGALTLEAEVIDAAGRAAGLRAQVPVSDQAIVVRAMPESGTLKPGVENTVYMLASTPDGAPADVTLHVVEGWTMHELETGPYGLAVLRFTPEGAVTLAVTARDAAGAESHVAIPLEADSAPAQLLLHVARAAYKAGETLTATALVSGEDVTHVYLDVVRAGQMVATLAAPVTAGQASFALDLDPGLVGALSLRGYALLDGVERIADSRLVVVDPPQGLDVAVTPDQPAYAPGDTARLAFEVAPADDIGDAGAALLGISIVDESVLALETLPPSFARAYFLVNEQMLARQGAVAGLDLPTLLETGVEQAEAAQDLAARAAWAGAAVPASDLSARARADSGSAPLMPADVHLPIRQAVAGRLSVALAVLPVLLSALVVQRLWVLALAPHVLRRLGWGILVLVVLMPLLMLGLVIGWLLPLLGAHLFFVLCGVALILLGVITVNGWVCHDPRLQVVTMVLICYLVLAGWLVTLAARGSGPVGGVAALVVATFLLLVAAVAVLGQGLVVEGRRGVGWAATALALVLILMAVTAPAVPALHSGLVAAAGHPGLYAGPLGWLTGCAMATPEMAPPSEALPSEAPPSEAPPTHSTERTAAPEPGLDEGVEETPVPPAATMAAPTPTPLPIPAEPYPLRQIFPETLYWNPAAETDGEGRLVLDVAVADTITAWRVTALASTRSGEIGAGSAQLVVTQPLFVEIVAPDEIRAGAPLTLTLSVYNLQLVPETVRWELAPGEGYTLLRAPQALTVAAASGASTTWVIRPEKAGMLELVVSALGERSGDSPLRGDRVQVTLDVLPEAEKGTGR